MSDGLVLYMVKPFCRLSFLSVGKDHSSSKSSNLLYNEKKQNGSSFFCYVMAL